MKITEYIGEYSCFDSRWQKFRNRLVEFGDLQGCIYSNAGRLPHCCAAHEAWMSVVSKILLGGELGGVSEGLGVVGVSNVLSPVLNRALWIGKKSPGVESAKAKMTHKIKQDQARPKRQQ